MDDERYHVGFTGTRRGMTLIQLESVASLLSALVTVSQQQTFLHHGGCHGADRDMHDIFGFPTRTIIYPSSHEQWEWAQKQRAYLVCPIMAPLDRNRLIVAAANVMIATPAQRNELSRGSGTWATIRYARRAKVTLYVCWPDGDVTKE